MHQAPQWSLLDPRFCDKHSLFNNLLCIRKIDKDLFNNNFLCPWHLENLQNIVTIMLLDRHTQKNRPYEPITETFLRWYWQFYLTEEDNLCFGRRTYKIKTSMILYGLVLHYIDYFGLYSTIGISNFTAPVNSPRLIDGLFVKTFVCFKFKIIY